MDILSDTLFINYYKQIKGIDYNAAVNMYVKNKDCLDFLYQEFGPVFVSKVLEEILNNEKEKLNDKL